MDHIPMKTIQFPGLEGVYTIPSAPEHIGAVPKTITISATGTSLDDYKEEGTYYFPTATQTVNIPYGTNGWLKVIANGTNVKQIWYRSGTPGTNDFQTAIRTHTNTTGWGEWTKVLTSKDGTDIFNAMGLQGFSSSYYTIPAGGTIRVAVPGIHLLYGRLTGAAANANAVYCITAYSVSRAPLITELSAGTNLTLASGGSNDSGWYVDITNSNANISQLLFCIGTEPLRVM